MTGDEAYYWEWSRRLAAGYVDHPPAVAWLIAMFSLFGKSAGFVRLPFVLCGVVATIALARAAELLSGSRIAGAVSALLFALSPLAAVAFFVASPDGPYLCAWALALWCAAWAIRAPGPARFAFLGAALGAALLARVFAVALIAGVAGYALAASSTVWRRGFWWTLSTAGIVALPLILWNAGHHWSTFAFALFGRHVNEGVSLTRPIALLGGQAALFSPGIFVALLVCCFRRPDRLAAWTAYPLIAALFCLSLFERVEIYWFAGPFSSLCMAAGISAARLSASALRRWAYVAFSPATVILVILYGAILAPGPIYHAITSITSVQLRNSGPFEVFTYAPLARDVARLAAANDATVMTDGYGFSSVLDFEAGIPPVLVGYDQQGREARNWYGSNVPMHRALFVDKEPLASRPDFSAQLSKACASVQLGPLLAYSYSGAPPRVYFLSWCIAPVHDAVRILRWE